VSQSFIASSTIRAIGIPVFSEYARTLLWVLGLQFSTPTLEMDTTFAFVQVLPKRVLHSRVEALNN